MNARSAAAPTPSSDVVVVGAGLIGLAAAWRLAAAGLDVTVVDPAPGRGASWAAAGMLGPASEAAYGEQDLAVLNLAAARRWRAFAAELAATTGHGLGYERCGTVMVARDADDAAALRRTMELQQAFGLDVRWLRSRDLRDRQPALHPGVRGGIWVPRDHQVDNRAVVTALLAALARAGVRMVADRATAVVRTSAGRWIVACEEQSLPASSVVVAAGWASGTIDGVPTEALYGGVRPVKGQLLHLLAPRGPLATATVRGVEAYIVSRSDGRIVVGATVEELGEDRRVTAGAVHELLRAAWELLPGVAECELVETVAGLRPATTTNRPVIGAIPGRPGLVVATGHFRHGVLLCPLTAEAVAATVTGGTLPAEVVPFQPAAVPDPVRA